MFIFCKACGIAKTSQHYITLIRLLIARIKLNMISLMLLVSFVTERFRKVLLLLLVILLDVD